MSGDLTPWNHSARHRDFEPAAWPAPASRFHQSAHYSPQRQVPQPLAFRPSFQRTTSNNGRSYSRPNSRPTSSHGAVALPTAPEPPPASFISHVRHHRRKSSQTRDSPGKLSRKSKYWPPAGYDPRSILQPPEAYSLISPGACTYKGFSEPVINAPGHFRLFAVMEAEDSSRTDRAVFQDPAFEDITLTMMGRKDSAFPWVSLEQPCMASCFGKSPGTTTLTYYIGKAGSLNPNVQFGSKAKARKMKLINILERLKELEQCGIQEEEFERNYRYLYDKLIVDPEAETDPHYDRAMQIKDLLTVLCNLEWVDFSNPRNQVVAKWFDSGDEKVKRKFFHQLLLSIELYLRIEAREHEEEAKHELLTHLPPKVAWDLALAQRWLEYMSISRVQLSNTQSTFTFDLKHKARQKEALRTFASLLKWPNMDELDYILEETDPKEKSIEDRSADTMSWFTGVILPGPTLPWLLMNTLIDCDRDTGEELKYLTHIHPNSGFQYRANTYWSQQCIVGKVLGAGRGVKQVAGWIGPCHYTPELERTQCVLIRQLEPLDTRLGVKDVDSMRKRTTTLGPDDEEYPVSDYDLIVPSLDDVEDIIRIEKLSFNPVPPSGDRANGSPSTGRGAKLFDAAIVFAFAGSSLPITLRYNVDFIYAYPCIGGPHPLYHGYRHRVVRVDEGLAELKGWGISKRRSRGSGSRSRDPWRSQPGSPMLSPLQRPVDLGAGERLMIEDGFVGGEGKGMALALRRNRDRSRSLPRSRSQSPYPSILAANSSVLSGAGGGSGKRYPDEILVIEAFGVSDNEVFARAWCAKWGRSAIVANVCSGKEGSPRGGNGSPGGGSGKFGHSPSGSGSSGKIRVEKMGSSGASTCVACAVREAVAAGVGVVILTEGGRRNEGDLGIEI